MSTEQKLYLYPAWLRFWHWSNALIFIILVLTGLSMQYSSPDLPIIPFEAAVNIHNVCGIILTALYIMFIVGNLASTNHHHYRIDKDGMKSRIQKQLQYYMKGIFKGEKPPYQINTDMKFNPLQQITYVIIMYFLMPVIIVTGWGLIYPETTVDKILGQSGLLLTDLLHIIIGFFLSIFMISHIYFATISVKPGDHFKAMVKGYHEAHE